MLFFRDKDLEGNHEHTLRTLTLMMRLIFYVAVSLAGLVSCSLQDFLTSDPIAGVSWFKCTWVSQRLHVRNLDICITLR